MKKGRSAYAVACGDRQMRSLKSGAAFALIIVVGLIGVLGLAAIVPPIWMKIAPGGAAAASAFSGSISLIGAIAVLIVYWRQAEIMERQENLQRAWLIAGMGPERDKGSTTLANQSCFAILIITITDKPRRSSAISNGISAQTLLRKNQIGTPASAIAFE
jgi:hypothetical protein